MKVIIYNTWDILFILLKLFKEINDNFGHKQGDKVLFYLAQRVQAIIRNTDYLYRFGGEEFSIIATNSELKDACKFAETIREGLEYTPSLSEFNITVSIGVAPIEENDTADSWFRRTDLALYHSKSNGRNSVSFAKGDYSGTISLYKTKDKKNLKVQPSNKVKKKENADMIKGSDFNPAKFNKKKMSHSPKETHS